MGRTITVLSAVLLFSFSAAAQGPAGVGAAPAPLKPWQLAIGYQYNKVNLTGQEFQTNGVNLSATRFFGAWVGLEAQLGFGFGNTGSTTAPPNLAAKSLSVMAGPRLAYRGHGRIEPWMHGGMGMQHFRLSQTAGLLGSNTSLAWQGGGGLDFTLSPNIAARTEVDFLWTRLFNFNQRHFQVIGGLVFNF